MTLPFPDIDPVALSLGPLDIRWYSLAYLAGFLLGWRVALYLSSLAAKGVEGYRPKREDIDNFLPFAVLGVILGGRLGYILFYQSGWYLGNPLEILKIWEGGMAFHGGALGVILALIIYSWRQKIPLLRLSDIVCAVVPIGLFFGRIANFINGELFGRVASKDVPWAVIFPYGGLEPRHPSQLYEAFLEGAFLFAILMILMHKKWIRERSGIVTGAFLALYALFRMSVEQFREPDAHLGLLSAGLSMGQWLSIPMCLLGLGVILCSFRKGTHKA
ncbi:MAG: prolipoprotein diacylglyceryl transferase [Alphaproteobacteria bacterium]|nr:prolipoprotein diacylglyceryl transferase [Alphaproteobacteria bacterium]